MDSSFTPSRAVFATVKNAFSYVFRNIGNFNDLLKLYLPYIVAAVGLMVGGALLAKNGHVFGFMLLNYIYLCMTISWYQLLVQGPEKASFTAPFPPSRAVWRILGLMAGIFAAVLAAALLFYALSRGASQQAMGIALVILMPIGLWALMRLTFYQVIAAIDSPKTIKDAFALARGYVAPVFLAGFIMSWILMGFYLVYYMAVGFVQNRFNDGSDKFPDSTGEILVYHLTELPNYIYISPLMTILIATICANYYLVATKGDGK